MSLRCESGRGRRVCRRAGRLAASWLPVGLGLVVAGAALVRGQTNGILREVFANLPGSALANLTSAAKYPASPDSDSIDPTFEAPVNFSDNYGQRMRALLLPPQTGTYTFWISSDDQSALYLSTSEDPAAKKPIAGVSGWTASREWTKEAGQKSAGIRLTNGFRYYVEAIQKEGGGGDSLAVRWQLPSGAIEEPIPAKRMVPFGAGPPQIKTQPADATAVEGTTALFSVSLSRILGATFQWQHQGTNLPGATAATCVFGPVQMPDDGAEFVCQISNVWGSVTTRTATLNVARDVVPPSLASVGTPGDLTLVTVVFTEAVEPASATKVSNYLLSPGATVLGATFGPDDRTILLTTTPMVAGMEYTLRVGGVRDRADLPNVISSGARASFNLNLVPLSAAYLRPQPEPPGPSSRHGPVVLSEIMVHPAPRADGRNLEFIELYNSNPYFEDIGGWRIAGQVDFTFPRGTLLPAQSSLVVAAEPADVSAVYGITGVAGPYAGRLANSAGTLRLLNRQGAILFEVAYSGDPPWPAAADGAGHSLVLARPSLGERDPAAWAASDVRGGSPGRADSASTTPWQTVVINEFLAHTDPPQVDFVELYNYSASPVDLSGCVLTDDPATNRFAFPPGTSIPALGFVALEETQLGFALNAAGETIYLVSPDDTRVLDAVRFGAQENGVATGRYPDGAPTFSRLGQPTPGAANAPIRLSPVVINELMYDPISGDEDDQYAELYNRAGAPVDVSGWRLEDGIRFVLASGTVIPPDGYLVVARNPERLLTNYAGLDPTQVQGPFSGSLAGRGERVALSLPDDIVQAKPGAAATTNRVHIVVDEVTYRSGGRWGRWAHGGGSSLELVDARADHRLAPNWADSDETAKSDWTTIEVRGVLDNGNGTADSLQIVALDAGEYLVDNVEVIPVGGTNLIANPDFESGLDGWVAQGNHEDSSLETGEGDTSQQCLHVRATGRGDTGANRIRVHLTSPISAGRTATIRARVRWLAGFPEILFRLHGNWLEATGNALTARNLGTPGTRNSRALDNAPPAITDVRHYPPVPVANQPVQVTARVHDPDGLSVLLLRYRLDPDTNFLSLPMTPQGAGLFGAVIPAQTSGRLVAFHVAAADRLTPSRRSLFPNDAPARECLVRWGDPTPASAFGTYRVWMTQATLNRWSQREKLSNKPLDVTFVDGARVIYNAGAMYSGSPWHAPGFNSPTGNVCDYAMYWPADDPLLGETEGTLQWPGNGGGDNSYQREQTAYWIASQLGLPYCYRRHVNLFVAGVRRTAYFEDVQQPNGDMVDASFPEGRNGDLHKVQLWFEFDDAASAFTANGASLDRVTTTGGVKKLARYRWTWAKRALNGSANNYTNLFALVDAVNNSLSGTSYSQRVESAVDVDNWLRTYAVEHIVGNNDSYAYGGGQNMYAYKATGDTWKLMIWDIDFAFASQPPNSDLFNVGGRNIGPDLTYPPYRRLYWQILQEAANGPLVAANVNPVLDAKYAAMIKAGLAIDSPASIENFISQRRAYILGLIASNATASFAVTSGGGRDFATNKSLITLAGTAPIEVRTLLVNGLAWPVNWTSITNWSVTVALTAGDNVFLIRGLDQAGAAVRGATKRIVVRNTLATDAPADSLCFSEIMVGPAVLGGGYVELFNRSSTTSFDLSGWRIDGLGFTFPAGTVLRPRFYALVVEDRAVFQAAYGANRPVVGEYTGHLDKDGETLKLVRPGTDGASEVVVNEMTYGTTAPWPATAEHPGASLQIRDADQDDSRVANWATAGAGQTPATPGFGNSVAETLPAFPPLCLNEVQPVNQFGPIDHFGHHHPWVELYNGGMTNVVLDGLAFSDNLTNLTRWPFPAGTTVPAHGFRVVWLDGQPGESTADELHAGFSLAANAGFLALARDLAGAPQLLDYLQIPPLLADRSFGSYPEGRIGGRRGFDYPTPGVANDPAVAPVQVVINEWMADNQTTLADPADGEFDDWFELYNAADTVADLSGYYLGSDTNNPTQFRIPNGISIPAHGFLLVWADGDTGQNSTQPPAVHTNFKLAKAGESIGLFDPNGRVLDFVTFGPQATDRSEGRKPDGSATVEVLTHHTPGAANGIDSLQIQAITLLPPTGVTVTFHSIAGMTYQLEATATLESPDWRPAGAPVVASGGLAQVSDAPGDAPRRFYRLRLVR